MESETPVVDGFAGESFGKTFHNEVRAFVCMRDGVVKTKAMPVPVGRHQHFSLEGLDGAEVTLFLPPSAVIAESFDLQRVISGDNPVPCCTDKSQGAVHVSDYTGTLYVAW